MPTGSSERFGYEWDVYSGILPDYEEQFRRWTSSLDPKAWAGAYFLDGGCGMGRNSYWAMRWGAAGGVSIDIDERSLAAAQENLKPYPAVKIERASLYEVPYQDAFDIAFSIGVIHHVEDPGRALASLVRAVKPGGRVMIWVYGRENNGWVVYGLDPLRKLVFSRLPIGLVHALSTIPTAGVWVGLRLGLGKTDYSRLARRFTFAHLRSIIFDQMLPRISNYWPQDTVRQLMKEAGLEDIQLTWVNQMSWSAVGTKKKA